MKLVSTAPILYCMFILSSRYNQNVVKISYYGQARATDQEYGASSAQNLVDCVGYGCDDGKILQIAIEDDIANTSQRIKVLERNPFPSLVSCFITASKYCAKE